MLKKRFSWKFFLIFFVLTASAIYGKEKRSRDVLQDAIANGDLLKVQSLIESKTVGLDEVPKKDYDGSTPLVQAAGYGQFSIMKYLVEKGASIEGLAGKKHTPLTRLIEKGSSKLTCQQLLEMFRFLIDSGADVNCPGQNGYTPLMHACKYTRCIELVKMLIDLGALVDAKADDEHTALFLSVQNTNVKAFRLLIESGALTSIDCKGLSLLGFAAANGNIPMAKLIIQELKADVNKYDLAGGTPICWAAVTAQDSMISFLVENGADINAKTKNAIDVEKHPKGYALQLGKNYVTFPKNCTPLNLAKWTESISTINLIIDLGGMEFEQFVLKEWNSFDYLHGRSTISR